MERPYMSMYFADFFSKTTDLEADEIGVYFVLLGIAWLRPDAALPNDMDWLKRSAQAHIAGFHGHTFNKIVPGLLERYFTLGGDNQWHNNRMRQEYDKWLKRSSNGRQSALIRHHGIKNINKLPDANALLIRIKDRKRLTKEEIGATQRLRNHKW